MRWLVNFLWALLYCACVLLHAGEPTRVLYLGNSYTYYQDLPLLVAQLAASAPQGQAVEYEKITPGGCSLEGHAANQETLAAITSGAWDYVVLQEHSMRPIVEPDGMLESAMQLQAVVARTKAKTVMFMTWPRQNTPETMADLERAYRNTAEKIGASIAPVGLAWMAALKVNPSIVLYDNDGSHPAPAGSYLAACVIASTLTGLDPSSFSAPAPSGVTEAEAVELREIAAATLKAF